MLDIEGHLAELHAEYDPIIDHDRIMEATRPTIVLRDDPQSSHDAIRPQPQQLIYKDGPGRVTRQPPPPPGDDPPLPLLTDDLVDALAEVLVELRKDCRVMIDEVVSALRERVAVLEGQMAMLVNLLGGNNPKSLEASEIIRKVRVG